MITTGIIRRIDDLGRIAIPREIRKKLKVSDGDTFEIFMTREGEIILKPYKEQEEELKARLRAEIRKELGLDEEGESENSANN